MGVKITDNMPKFRNEADAAADRALQKMTVDIIRIAIPTTPHLKGQLIQSAKPVKIANLQWEAVYNKEYARYQEFGGDEKRVVKNYSEPGTGAHYLKNAGDQVKAKANDYFKAEGSNIRI